MRVEIKAMPIDTVRGGVRSPQGLGAENARSWNMGFGFIARRKDNRISILDAVAL